MYFPIHSLGRVFFCKKECEYTASSWDELENTPSSDLEICLSRDFAKSLFRQISWSSGGVFSNTSLLSAVYYYILVTLLRRGQFSAKQDKASVFIHGDSCQLNVSSSCTSLFSNWFQGFLFSKFAKLQVCMLPTYYNSSTDFRTVFVFALRPILPMWVLFFCFNGNYNGKTGKTLFFCGPQDTFNHN